MEENKKVVTLSTFVPTSGKSRMPIASARQRSLQTVIGNVFKINGGFTEEVENRDDNGKIEKVSRAVYECQTLNSRYLQVGTKLTIKIKNATSILNPEQNKQLLLNTGTLVAAFDDLNHWSMPSNGMEGLSASEIRVLDIPLQEALKLGVKDEN